MFRGQGLRKNLGRGGRRWKEGVEGSGNAGGKR